MTQAPPVPLPFQRSRTCPFDPAPEIGARRAGEPVSRFELPSGDQAWLVTRHADVRQLLGDARFSNTTPSTLLRPPSPESEVEEPPMPPGMFVGMDPPQHTRLRRMVTGAFTVKRMERMRPSVQRIVADQLDAVAAADRPVDLVEAFAMPIPSLVMCELLGVPTADRADFQRRSRAAVDIAVDPEHGLEMFLEMQAYMTELVAEQRARPGPEMLGMLVREHGDELTDDELVGIGNMLLAAGHETTAHMLAAGALLLLQHPDQAAVIRDDPAAVSGAVEEMLRYLSVVPSGLIRTATADFTMNDTLIRAGGYVVGCLPAANRDELRYPDPDRFDIGRSSDQHLAFGHGVHHCIGAPLARLEMRVAFPALLRRFPGLRLAVPLAEIRFREMANIYGVQELPVSW